MKRVLFRDFDKYRSVCIRNNFFASGSNEQYSKVHGMMRERGVSLEDLALVTWLCSSGRSYAQVLEILEKELQEV